VISFYQFFPLYVPFGHHEKGPLMGDTVRDRFLAVLPLRKLRLLRDRVLEEYPAVPEFYQRHFSNIADRRLLTRMWTASVQDSLLAECQDDPALYAVASTNRARTWGFALVESSGFLFTAVTLRSMRSKPPTAQYREELGDQLQMFAPRPPSRTPIDALLIHVPPRRLDKRPAQLFIRFLNGEGAYLPEVIDLLALDHYSVVRLPSVRKERVERVARVTVKRQRTASTENDR
jgi:hypothetical protein